MESEPYQKNIFLAFFVMRQVAADAGRQANGKWQLQKWSQ